MKKPFFRVCSLLFVFVCLLSVSAFAVGDSGDVSDGYLPEDEFLEMYGNDYSIEVYAVQSEPNSPVTSSPGLKGILLDLFGPYDPVITQLRYQSNTSSNYTYVNNIDLDYPWLCSAGIFAIVLYCLFKMGGALLCRL